MSGEKIKTYKELIEAIEEKYPLTLINHKKWGDGSQRFIFFFKTPLGEEEELKRLGEYFGGVGIDITMTYDRFSPLPYHVVISVLNKEQEVGKTLIKFYSEDGVQKVYDKIINALNNIFSPSAGLKRKREQRTKELWEMTREEFKAVPIQKTSVGYEGYFGLIKAEMISAPDGKVYKVVPITKGTPFWTEYGRKKEGWKYAVLNGKGEDTGIRLHKINELYDIIHKRAVEQALKEGKPVSDEVLKDYPDLAEKYGRVVKERKHEKLPIPKEEIEQLERELELEKKRLGGALIE